MTEVFNVKKAYDKMFGRERLGLPPKEPRRMTLRERHDLADPMQYLIKRDFWCPHCHKFFELGLSPDRLKEQIKALEKKLRRKK